MYLQLTQLHEAFDVQIIHAKHMTYQALVGSMVVYHFEMLAFYFIP